ncbi:MAG: hypothetical protein A3D92_11555 [Bacteroidetes bacterium RIFCSPHIGHO2_02_FULL_44_7]|nr:MAG: hypothetical protein A3D92_11555 [Bacteroidetes bacterium RIFCSPHIGHO2_02_FULL_44_7]
MKIIGRKERAAFPEFNLRDVLVKIDSGAYTSSIHCDQIIRENNNTVSCVFLDPEMKGYTGEVLTFDVVKEVIVRSSNGSGEKRCMIRSSIELGGEMYPIYLTLTNRNDMRYPVLLGRRFLSKRFLIDVSKSGSGKRKEV